MASFGGPRNHFVLHLYCNLILYIKWSILYISTIILWIFRVHRPRGEIDSPLYFLTFQHEDCAADCSCMCVLPTVGVQFYGGTARAVGVCYVCTFIWNQSKKLWFSWFSSPALHRSFSWYRQPVFHGFSQTFDPFSPGKLTPCIFFFDQNFV